MHLVHSFIESAYHKADLYHVDPKIFLGIYALHYPIVWSAFAWIIVAYRRKQNVTTMVTFWIFSMMIPWIYPLFFGHLPWYLYAAIIALMVYIAWHGYHTIQKRLAKEKARSGTQGTAEETA